MIQIKDKLISSEIFEQYFCCDYLKCKGICCVEGDGGAPLLDEEAEILESEFKNIVNYISPEGLNSIEKSGKWVLDDDGEKLTPLINGGECAYAVFQNGIAKCAIEQAFENNATGFQKPRSCHLYPIRVSKIGDYLALNYHKWYICESARFKGKKEKIPLYRFLKIPLIKYFGKAFYDEIEYVYSKLNQNIPD